MWTNFLQTLRNTETRSCGLGGEDKFKMRSRIVSLGLDVWGSASIDFVSFKQKQGKGSTSSNTSMAELGGFLNTFYHTLFMKGVDIVKELTAAVSPIHRKEFAVSYSFLLGCFGEYFRSKFPHFGAMFLGKPFKRMVNLLCQLWGAARGNTPAVSSQPVHPLHAQEEPKSLCLLIVRLQQMKRVNMKLKWKMVGNLKELLTSVFITKTVHRRK